MLNFAERGYRTETWVAILRFLLFLCVCVELGLVYVQLD